MTNRAHRRWVGVLALAVGTAGCPRWPDAAAPEAQDPLAGAESDSPAQSTGTAPAQRPGQPPGPGMGASEDLSSASSEAGVGVPPQEPADAGAADPMVQDGSSPDAMMPDAMMPDAMMPDAMLPDAMMPGGQAPVPPPVDPVASGCEPEDLGYLGAVAHVDGQDRAPFLTSRDCGFSVRVAGTDASGSPQSRDLWIFCDSPGFDLAGQPWPQTLGFPTNTAALSDPAGYPNVPQLRSHAFGDGIGGPLALKPFIGGDLAGVADSEPTRGACSAAEGYRVEWPQGAVTLPDTDPGTEHVLVFYQNWCVRADGFINFSAGTAGLALYTWRSDAPDAEPVARRLTDRWFAAGLMRNQGSGVTEPTNTYGSGAVVHAGHLYVSMCGASGNCQTARTPLADGPSPEALADTSRWSYLSYSGWADFPAPGPSGTCVPTFEDSCGGNPPTPYPSSTAEPGNPLTMPQAPPTVHQVGDGYVMVYSPWGLGGTDSFVWRWAPWPEGPYGDPSAFSLGPQCASDSTAAFNLGCRAATLHPHFRDAQGRLALSYWDYDGALGEGQGRLRLAMVCQP